MRDESVTGSERGVTLADFTGVRLIIPHLRGRDVASVIQELSQALQREGRVPSLLPFYDAALNREFLVTSEMEGGVAFPHARLAGLRELSFALGRSDESLVWRAGAPPGVRLVFLIAVPATDSARYLLLVSGLVRLSQDAGLMERLRGAPDSVHLLKVLGNVSLRRPVRR